MAPAHPSSPLKRVTRARAAATKSVEPPKDKQAPAPRRAAVRSRTKPTEEKETENSMPEQEESLRKSARRVGTTAGARRIKVTPLNKVPVDEGIAQEETQVAAPGAKKTRSVRMKTTTTKEETARDVPGKQATKPKRQANTTKGADPLQETIPKLRGRPKKVEQTPAEPQAEPRMATRQTRTRAGSGAANTRSLTAAPSKLTTAPKKKVTFQDPTDNDKENRPLPRANASNKGKTASATLGLKAKPVRRPAATVSSSVKSAQAAKKAQKAEPETAAQRVLTPKKVTQIAKSSSPVGTDEDELAGAKTPLKNLTQSPKRNATIAKADSPVKKLDLGISMHASPNKDQAVPALLSPARRQGLSPFKDALKESPKRGEIIFKLPQPKSSQASFTSGDQVTPSSSTLSQSPKRAMLDSYVFPKSPLKVSKSPFKASLLKSPPKRLISPVKAQSLSKEDRPSTPPRHMASDILSPDVAVSSHFKVSQSPQRSLRVHKMSAEELQEEVRSTIDFDQSIVDIRSPLKVDSTPSVFRQQEVDAPKAMSLDDSLEAESPVAQAQPQPATEEADFVMADAIEVSEQSKEPAIDTVDPANILLQKDTPVNPSSLLFRGRDVSDDDDSSEDELQSPIRKFAVDTPATIGVKGSRTLAALATADQQPGFTPLAAQLSGWLASSPDKKALHKATSRGLFSPVAAQHVPGEVVVDRHSPAVSRISTEPRISLSAARSPGSRTSMTQGSSASVAADDSPYKISYFAEAMAVKDLEDEILTMGDDEPDSQILEAATYEAAVKNIDNDVASVPASQDAIEDPEIVSGDESAEPKMGLNRRSLIFEELLTNFSPGKDEITITLPESPTAAVVDEPESPQPEETIAPFGSPTVQTTTLVDESSSPMLVGLPPTPNVEIEEENIVLVTSPTTPSNAPATGPVHEYKFVTPAREALKSRYAHTVVSKVPLREEGFVSPIKVPKKRSLSVSAGVSPPKRTAVMSGSGLVNSKSMPSMSPGGNLPETPYSNVATPGQQSFAVDDFGDSTLDGIEIDEDDENLPPVTPMAFTNDRSQAATHCKTPQVSVPESAPTGVLQGAVVFVDVHTTEGADASGIFVELLTQMGARCVKNWTWNSRASMGANSEGNATTPASKIGITHVVYKDGGKRTLEKVRDTEGLVKCVGVGWVLDCERENHWIDESTYAIDISVFPRGGSRRRKSMEPRALLNSNGNLIQAGAASVGRRSFSAEMSKQMKEELVNTPVRGRSVAVGNPVQETRDFEAEDSELDTPDVSMLDGSERIISTPTGFVNYDPADPAFQTPGPNNEAWDGGMGGASPTTPFYLSQGSKLIQMTCPPKQTGKGLFDGDDAQSSKDAPVTIVGKENTHKFPISKKVVKGADGALGRRIADARRRTLGIEAGWKPSVASPLGRH